MGVVFSSPGFGLGAGWLGDVAVRLEAALRTDGKPGTKREPGVIAVEREGGGGKQRRGNDVCVCARVSMFSP